MHPDWIFCSFTAAILHGLWVANARLDIAHVRVDGRESTRKSLGCIQCHLIAGDEFAMQCGLRVTSLHRTVLDCLCATGFCEGLGIVDAALHWGMTDLGSIARYAAEHGARRPGIVGARRVLTYADGGSENGGESLARGMMIELGFAVPELQVEFADPMEPGNPKRVDFCWRCSDGRVIVGELDGLAKYGGGERVVDSARAVQVLAKECRREAHLNLTGATVIRFSLAEALDASYFAHLLSSAGVPRAQPWGMGPYGALTLRWRGWSCVCRVAVRRQGWPCVGGCPSVGKVDFARRAHFSAEIGPYVQSQLHECKINHCAPGRAVGVPDGKSLGRG